MGIAANMFKLKLAIEAASKLIDEAMECGIIDNEDDAQHQFDIMVDGLMGRDVEYIYTLIEKGLGGIYETNN